MNKPINVNIDINQTYPIVCSECGNNVFIQAYYMRKVSAVIAGEESILPIPVFECSQCGNINEEFKPKDINV